MASGEQPSSRLVDLDIDSLSHHDHELTTLKPTAGLSSSSDALAFAGPGANGGPAELEFKNLPLGTGLERHSLDINGDNDSVSLLRPSPSNDRTASAQPAVQASVWSLEYYRQYFDVTTEVVSQRLLRTFNPFTQTTFYCAEDSKPDLYAPFWIATTLVFLMAATGNFANYLSFEPKDDTVAWTYDIEKMTTAATMFYVAITILPLLVWLVLRRLPQGERALAEVISIYGYSLFVFVPTCVLCVIPSEVTRWTLMSASLFLSVAFLLRNLYMVLSSDAKKLAVPLLAFIVGAHMGIALGMKLYFFQFNN